MPRLVVTLMLVAVTLLTTALTSNEIEVYLVQPDLVHGFDLDFPESERMYIPTIAYNVVITAYSSTRGQCDDDPHITASMTRPQRGTIALSRDLLKRFTPHAPFSWGDEVWIDFGNGLRTGPYYVEDTMAKRKRMWVDVWQESTAEARNAGLQKGRLLSFKRDPNKLLLSDLI